MQTIKIEIEDSLYENLVAKGIDIQSKIKEFIYETMDDGYPAISFEEAKQRVADAVEEYRSGKGEYTPLNDDFWEKLESKINNYDY